MKGWVALVGWRFTDINGHWSPVSCRSSAGQGKFAGQRHDRVEDRWTTTMPRNNKLNCRWHTAGRCIILRNRSVHLAKIAQRCRLPVRSKHGRMITWGFPRRNVTTPAVTHGKAYNKKSSTKLLVNAESGYVRAWRQRDITLNICYIKPALFGASTLHNRLFLQPPTIYRGKHVTFCVISITAI